MPQAVKPNLLPSQTNTVLYSMCAVWCKFLPSLPQHWVHTDWAHPAQSSLSVREDQRPLLLDQGCCSSFEYMENEFHTFQSLHIRWKQENIFACMDKFLMLSSIVHITLHLGKFVMYFCTSRKKRKCILNLYLYHHHQNSNFRSMVSTNLPSKFHLIL